MLTYAITPQHGPSPLLALLPAPDLDAITETAIALANADGGTIVIGLDASGVYSGPVDAEALDTALHAASVCCTPAISLGQPRPLNTPPGPVVTVRVPRGQQVHTLPDGRVMARMATGNHQLDGDEIRRLVAARAHDDFERVAVPGTTADDLDPARVEMLLARCDRGEAGTDGDLLRGLGAITPDGQATVAGLLLFGSEPQRWLPHSGARLVRYVGEQPIVERPITGTLPELVDGLWEALQEQLGARQHIFPASAVREALVNAVCHRDYRLRNGCVDVELYRDRLAITSPGGLPGFLAVKHLMNGRFSRNPRLAWGMWRWGYVPAPGRGFGEMITAIALHGGRPLTFDAQPYQVTVRLFGHEAQNAASDTSTAALTARQQDALAYVAEHGSITLREFCTLHRDVKPALLQHDLASLETRGKLLKIDARTGAYYIAP